MLYTPRTPALLSVNKMSNYLLPLFHGYGNPTLRNLLKFLTTETFLCFSAIFPAPSSAVGLWNSVFHCNIYGFMTYSPMSVRLSRIKLRPTNKHLVSSSDSVLYFIILWVGQKSIRSHLATLKSWNIAGVLDDMYIQSEMWDSNRKILNLVRFLGCRYNTLGVERK